MTKSLKYLINYNDEKKKRFVVKQVLVKSSKKTKYLNYFYGSIYLHSRFLNKLLYNYKTFIYSGIKKSQIKHFFFNTKFIALIKYSMKYMKF